MTEWPDDPQFDCPSRFAAGDFVRLADGRPAVVRLVQDYAGGPPARWELVVTAIVNGQPDDFIVEPWRCRLDPTSENELEGHGLVSSALCV